MTTATDEGTSKRSGNNVTPFVLNPQQSGSRRSTRSGVSRTTGAYITGFEADVTDLLLGVHYIDIKNFSGSQKDTDKEFILRPSYLQHSGEKNKNGSDTAEDSAEGSNMSNENVSRGEYEAKIQSIEDRIDVRFEALGKQIDHSEQRTKDQLTEVLSRVEQNNRSTKATIGTIVATGVFTIIFGVVSIVAFSTNANDEKNALRIEKYATETGAKIERLSNQLSNFQSEQQQLKSEVNELDGTKGDDTGSAN